MDELLNKAPCGFLAFSDDGLIAEVNATLLNLLGRERRELQGTRVESIFSIAGRIFFQTHFYPLLKMHGKAEEIYLTLRSSAGEDVPVLANAVRHEREGRTFNDCVFVCMRQRGQYENEILLAKREAEAANRLKDEFLATVSHELRTPLTAMIGWVHLLRSGALNAERAGHALEVIERNASAQAQLINDLLDASRIITGKMQLNVQPVDPAKLIENAIESLRPASEAKNVRIQKSLNTGFASAGAVSGDPDRLQQVVWNLLTNAVKFTPPGGRVMVRLERVGSHVEIIVSDNGIGINPEFLPYVFDRFRQSDMSSTRQHSGLGLGLAIVRHLVELHGGTVRVESAGEGEGATFTVALPLAGVYLKESVAEGAHATDEESRRVQECDATLEGIRVLVVDDEADMRELLKVMLGGCGAHVTVAATTREALQKVEELHPEVIISDIEMPGEDGYELIRQLRALAAERGGRIPAVALTAHTRAEDRLRIIKAGFQMHVAKPVELGELVTIVASLSRSPEVA